MVFPARLYGRKEKTGAKIEVFLLRELNADMHLWDVLVDPARKIRVGNKLYFGDNEELVAMTGQRLHVENYTEISAVCTHPDHLGKGYAYNLLRHQLQLILHQGQQAFLHVREDNERAIALYQRTGFSISRSMNFYFMKRE